MTALVAVVGGKGTSTTNARLVAAWRGEGIDAVWLGPDAAAERLRAGDVAVGRIDVRPALDGVEPGLLELLRLERRGVRVLNRAPALLATHDKLLTASRLATAGVPHPLTAVAFDAAKPSALDPPLVVKPRFGSWGEDVRRCDTAAGLEATLAELSTRRWFRAGAVVQQLVPPCGHDLRLLVAGGRVVGAIRRCAAPGEWRTNFSLGGTLEPVVPPPDALALAVAAAAAVEGDFVGVDLLPAGGRWIVIEVNGAVDFEPSYALPGSAGVDVDVAAALGLAAERGVELYAVAGTSSRDGVRRSYVGP